MGQLRAQVEHLGTIAGQIDHALRRPGPGPDVFDDVHVRACLCELLLCDPLEARRAVPG